MKAYVALLRGINVGGNAMVSMADLRETLTRDGYHDVKTLLQSGNVVFRSAKKPKIDELFGAKVFLRSSDEWNAAIEKNPFPKEARSDPALLVLMALDSPCKSVDALRAAIKGRERVEADGNHLYIFYPDGQGRSKFSHAVIERTLGARGTARNWNTVLKLQALL